MLSVAAVAAATVPVNAQSSAEISDLRQRISQIEQQLFQARMNSGPQYPAVEQLSARIAQLERDIASQRITDTTNRVLASGAGQAQPLGQVHTLASLAARVGAIEDQRAADAKKIEALSKRIEALEKPVFKPRVIKK